MQIVWTACTNIVKCSRPNAMRDQTRKIAFNMRQLNWSVMWLIECARRSSLLIDQNSGSVGSHAIFTSWTRHPKKNRSSLFAVRIVLKTKPTETLWSVECLDFILDESISLQCLHKWWPPSHSASQGFCVRFYFVAYPYQLISSGR